MNCDDFIKVQDLPDCWATGASLRGITIPANNTAVLVFFKNKATKLINIVEITSGAAGEIIIPMDNIAPLYPHPYEVFILSKPDRVNYELTIGTETGCSVRFFVHDASGSNAETLTLTADSCLTS